MTANASPIPVTYFGMTIESPNYNYAYKGGPVETETTIPVSIVRSWDVWSPGNGQIEYLDWSDLNPFAGVYNWTALNAWIATNQANNTQMVYTFGNPPAWAGGITTNLADFQAFVTAIVTQANGAIKYWEGFNEFDVSGIAPALLVQMQAIIYNTVHTLDPGALVLSPTVCGAGDDPLFAQFLADGGGKYFDIAAFHGYNNSTGEGIIPVVQDFQAVLAQYGLSNVPIWDTEWGMEAPTVITNTTMQEAYVSTGLILQAALGVQTEIFYAYDNANSALYNTATGQLTAAGVAYQQTEQWLTGATEPSGYQLNGSVYTVQLTKNGQSELIVWNSAGQSSYAAGPYTQYVDTKGQVHTIVNGVVTLGTVPILLETPLPTAPAVTSVATSGTGVTSGNGDLKAGSTVTLTLTMSEAVTVAGGAPTLSLNDGGTATYTGGSGGTALTFSYTAAAGQNTSDLTVTALNLNGATIKDGAGNGASISGTLSPAGTLQIDTTAPSAPVIADDLINGNNSVTLSGAAEANSTVTMYDGQAALGTTKANATGAWTYTTGTLANGPQVFTATATDIAGNTSAVSNSIDPIISQPPTMKTVTTAPASGDVESGGRVTITVTMSEVVNVIGTPALSLNDGAAATYLSGSGTNTLVFDYAVGTGQNTTALQLTGEVSGGSIADAAGNAAVIAAANLGLQINVDQWKKATSANWNTTADWSSPAGVPLSSDLVELNAAGKKYTVTSTANETIAELNTVSAATLAIASGVFTVTGGTGAGVQAGTISIASGATFDIGGLFDNTGTLLVNGGKLNVNGVLSGGTSQIGGAGKMVIAQACNENIAFLAKSTGELVLEQATSYTGQISGFKTAQSIDLTDLNFAAGVKMSYAPNNGTNTSGVLTVTDGTDTTQLQLQGTYTLANFKVVSDGNGGTLLTDPTVVTQKSGNAAATIGNDTVLEVNTPDAGRVTFSGTTGTLWLDQPSTFTGTVSGFSAQNVIDLPGIAFDSQTTLGYSPNGKQTGGTLALTDGSNSAHIALLGNYMASSFATMSDNHGGTMVVAEPLQTGSLSSLTSPAHA